MIVSYEIEHPYVDVILDFVKIEKSKVRKKVLYYKTIKESLSKIKEEVTTVLIPYELGMCDYDFESFIEHLRLTKKYNLSRALIQVVKLGEDETEQTHGVTRISEEDYFNFSVIYRLKETIETDADYSCSDKYYNYYINRTTQSPHLKGRHAISNLWGAYIAIKSLHTVLPQNNENEVLGRIEDTICEEAYFRNIINNFCDFSISKENKKKILRKRDELESTLDNVKIGIFKVLIIEDQLDSAKWRDFYELLFLSHKKIKLLYAIDKENAYNHLKTESDIGLILLDVRLIPEDTEHKSTIDSSGKKITEYIRSIPSDVPIIATTASNKSWTLEQLLKVGINNYWLKGSPDQVNTLNLGGESLFDLYEKISHAISWSIKTMGWQRSMNYISKTVRNKSSHTLNKHLIDGLEHKVKSFRAILFDSFQPHIEDLANGLQFNLAFLIAYSCLNDLAQWSCGGNALEDEWFLQGDPNNSALVKLDYDKDGNRFCVIQGSDKRHYNADGEIIKKILKVKNIESNFDFLKKVRNEIPLIHGRYYGKNKGHRQADESDITQLTKLLVEIVDHHVVVLTKLSQPI